MAIKKSQFSFTEGGTVASVIKEIDAYLTKNYRGSQIKYSSKLWWSLSREQMDIVVSEYQAAGWNCHWGLGGGRDDAEYLYIS